KAAGWLDAIVRQRTSIVDALEDTRRVQCGGASGTLAAFGEQGRAVADLLASRLGLASADIPWHAHRDRLARLACALGVACGTLGKIARDVALLGQTEIHAAIAPPGAAGGSSTMPHKRNPVRASRVLSSAVRAPGLVATMLTG